MNDFIGRDSVAIYNLWLSKKLKLYHKLRYAEVRFTAGQLFEHVRYRWVRRENAISVSCRLINAVMLISTRLAAANLTVLYERVLAGFKTNLRRPT